MAISESIIAAAHEGDVLDQPIGDVHAGLIRLGLGCDADWVEATTTRRELDVWSKDLAKKPQDALRFVDIKDTAPVVVAWEPTAHLREFFPMTGHDPLDGGQLQQLWVDRVSGAKEWRFIKPVFDHPPVLNRANDALLNAGTK